MSIRRKAVAMRSARRVATLVTVCTTAVLVALAPAAHAAPATADGSECVFYNGQVVYCIHYR